jgi:putative intracellular protease/amidase
VVVPALGCKTRETILAALERRDVADACSLLRAWSKSGTRVLGACTSTFVLASSGILDGGNATTTWWLSPVFREREGRGSRRTHDAGVGRGNWSPSTAVEETLKVSGRRHRPGASVAFVPADLAQTDGLLVTSRGKTRARRLHGAYA